jgi:hypothetical protein
MSTNRIRVRTARLLAATALVVPATLLSQDARTVADSLVHAADVAAYQSKPYEAIAAYERAIALDRYLRLPLLPRLGRQYLWSDRPKQAAQLFSEYLELHPRACETQLDLGLALSWANELDAARVAYDSVAAQCVYERGAARLGAARVLRWGNHFAESERRYRAIQADGSDLDREQAAIGLAYVRLAQGRPRAALALADSMIATGSNDRSLVEARAMALADLGALGAAVDLVHGEREAGRGSASMDRLAQGWEERARTSFALGTRGFRDHDGTSYRAAELASGAAPLALGKVRVTGRAAQLRGDGVELRSREVETALDLRPARAVALSARAGLSAYDDIAFSPWDGEINVAWLPSDRHRLDVAAAHVVINDNVAAIQNHLTGTFGSVGISERLTSGAVARCLGRRDALVRGQYAAAVPGDSPVVVRGGADLHGRVAHHVPALRRAVRFPVLLSGGVRRDRSGGERLQARCEGVVSVRICARWCAARDRQRVAAARDGSRLGRARCELALGRSPGWRLVELEPYGLGRFSAHIAFARGDDPALTVRSRPG